MFLLKEVMPYIVSIATAIISGAWSYIASKKKFNHELEIVKTNNKHDIDKLMEQHRVDIENLKEQHILEMEKKDKEYQHEKEMTELRSKVIINEKSQDTLNGVMSGIVGDVLKDVLSGKLSAEDLKNFSNQFQDNNK